MTRSTPVLRRLLRFALAPALALFVVAPAAGDWLVTSFGMRIPTQGPWTIDGDQVTFTDQKGVERSVPLSSVDLEESRKATEDADKVTLYSTSWCGYCRAVRDLLTEMDVDFVEKDIEADLDAYAEFQTKAGPRGAVPVLDIGGKVINGYKPQLIKYYAEQVPKKDDGEDEPASETPTTDG